MQVTVNAVIVTLHTQALKPNETMDQTVGRAHAALGFPVELRVARGNNSFVNHISVEEARALHKQLGEILP